jgi:putative ABC transport system permease protein
MKLLALAFRYLWARPLAALLNLLLLTLGLASITFVVIVSDQVTRAFQRDLAGIDLVVGAKGSPMQLILAGVFHIDVPPGNIALHDVQELAKKPQVAQLIPLSLGDSFGGFRVVGTTPAYLAHYQVQFAQGKAWTQPMEAVVGAQVAQRTGFQPGATFMGNHGLGAGGHSHGDTPYRVTGVLAPCGCVLDRLIVTSTESVWRVHEKKPAAHDGDHKAGADEHREVTMALVRYSTPLAAASFPRYVNTQTEMQAAAPAVEVTRLLRMLGVGSEVLQGVGAVLLLTAALSVFIALWTAVRERRADLAMLRMLGASPGKVAALLLAEGFWLAALASVLGLAAGHVLAALTGSVLQAQQSLPLTGWQWVPAEGWIPVAALLTAGVAALIPAVSAYRVDVSRLLHSR